MFVVLTLAFALAQSPAVKNDYNRAENWLCRPGQQDACTVDLTTTVITEDGRLTPEKFTANPNPAIDCFYVYPTVSSDPGGNSDMTPGAEERAVVQRQFARFAQQCRLFAPIYRQFTLTALSASASGKSIPSDAELGYRDVVDAWHHYLKADNGGRGVVLVGHSQGARLLAQLIQREIEGTPVQSRVVSALLLGTNILVPKGQDVGGTFKHMPLCRSAEQIGCVITYVSFRSTMRPPADTRFGRVQEAGVEVGCTNPAALAGGKGHLRAYLNAADHQWVTPAESISTPFVSVPRLLSGQCVSNEHGSYLEVTVNEDSHDPRADDIPGDVRRNGTALASWGLHLIDVAAAMGDLVDIVGRQAKAYLAKGALAQPVSATAGAVLQRLAGNWRLVKFVNVDESGAERDAGYDGGRIMYDVGGNMAAQLMRKTRENYVAYFGRVTVDPGASKVTHHVEGASIASWVGTDLVRYYEFSADGKQLKLSLRNAQGRITGTLTWERI